MAAITADQPVIIAKPKWRPLESEGNLALLPLDPDEYDLTNFGGKYRFGAPGARGRLELEAKFLGNRAAEEAQLAALAAEAEAQNSQGSSSRKSSASLSMLN